MKSFILIVCLVAFCSSIPVNKPSTNPFAPPKPAAAPAPSRQLSPSGGADGDARTISYEQTIPGDGTYAFSYETDNGISVKEAGRQKQIGEESGSDVNGEFSFRAPDGETYSVTYIADENGFQPMGAHLPTAPPVPESVVKLLAYLAEKGQL